MVGGIFVILKSLWFCKSCHIAVETRNLWNNW